MPRLFAGLELPPEATEALSGLNGELAGARWIEMDDLHMTLRFAGDLDGPTARELEAGLASIDAAAFSLEFTRLGLFGSEHPRALWAGFSPHPALLALQKSVERAARHAGLPPEGRKFTPHVTLAHLRGTTPLAVAQFIDGQVAFRLPTIAVSNLILYSARPGSGGGPYVVEQRYPLRGAEPDFSDAWSEADDVQLYTGGEHDR